MPVFISHHPLSSLPLKKKKKKKKIYEAYKRFYHLFLKIQKNCQSSSENKIIEINLRTNERLSRNTYLQISIKRYTLFFPLHHLQPSSFTETVPSFTFLKLQSFLLFFKQQKEETIISDIFAIELIPNLPDNVARECLLRASYKQFPIIASVCKGWNREVSLSEFLQQRHASGHSQELLIVTQARVDRDQESASGKNFATPEYRVAVLESGSGIWTELPPIPGQTKGLPLFCRLTSVGSDLVILGGLDPITWQASDSVFVFSFLTSKWRVGAAMPGVRRSFFGCASDSDQTVLVAGGHDEEKQALMSAVLYDVAEDKWTLLPDMARERDECKAIFHADKFHVIGGYATEEQGQFSKTAESFNASTWLWGPLTEKFLLTNGDTTSPPICAAGENGDVYACCGGDVMVLRDDTWQKVGQVPVDVNNVTYVGLRPGKLIVVGKGNNGETTVGYICELSSSRWVKMETQAGHVQAGCVLVV